MARILEAGFCVFFDMLRDSNFPESFRVYRSRVAG